MGAVGTILITVLIFGLVIMIHELGHFITAKLCKVTVHEFALGMGPKLFEKTKGETKYSLRLLPIGGYVQMEGEDSESDSEGSFSKKKIWQRILIVAAGAIMNLILGFILTVLLVSLFTPKIASTTIAQFAENAMTEQTGLQLGDKILRINDRRINIDQDIIFELQRDEDLVVDMLVERDGVKTELNNVKFGYTEQFDERSQQSYKQIQIDFKVLGVEKNIFNVLHQSFHQCVVTGKMIWVSLIDLIRNFQLNKISGFVGVGEVIGEAAGMGFDSLLNIVVFITINLGIFNLLPIPALDGGRLLFLVIEAIRRKPIPAKYEGMIHAIGFAALILLMIVVTFKDVFTLFTR